jgi:uncharacterized protein (DUF433 family)
MTIRKVSSKEVLQDIRSGMDETAIRQKYNLSAKGLENLYEKLIKAGFLGHDLKPVARKLNISDILRDVSAGMSKSDLMAKYNLSEQMIREVSKKLLEVRGKRSADDGPNTVIEEPGSFLTTDEFVRHHVDFELPVYEASKPDVLGIVRDVSEEGVGLAGIEATAGDVKRLVILGDEFGEFSSFEFEGYCRWAFEDEDRGTCVTGFGITKIADKDMKELKKLVRVITVG